MPHELTSPLTTHSDHSSSQQFLELSPADQVSMLLDMPFGERMAWARLLPLDDAADLVQAGQPDEREGLLALLDDAARREVTALMAYSEDVAGGLMNPRFMRLRPELTVDEAISYLRKQGPDITPADPLRICPGPRSASARRRPGTHALFIARRADDP